MKNLIYFTFSYPYSNDFLWKRYELEELKKYFKITIIPYISAKHKLNNVPSDINVIEPLIDEIEWKNILKSMNIGLFFHIGYYFKELINSKAYLNKHRFLQWAIDVLRTETMLNNKYIKCLMKDLTKSKDFILYFYWGLGCSNLIPFFKKYSNPKTIVRFHGFDLYEERKIGYFPFRSCILSCIDHSIFISKHGLNYLEKKYSHLKFNRHLFKIGSKSAKIPNYHEHKIFRIASCSNVVPLKRVEFIPMALKKLNFEIEWIHLGDGRNFKKLKEKCNELPKNIKYELFGRVSPEQVLKVYSSKNIDLFLNISTTEGLPISIMEAFSAGIPVLATDVGGTSEIVNQSNGWLLNPKITPSELAEEIRKFYLLDDYKKKLFHTNARKTYLKSCNIEKLNKNFVNFLLNL